MEVTKPILSVRIIPKTIPSIEKKLLCATFLDAVIRFYENPENESAFEKWYAEKGENIYGQENSRHASRKIP